MRAIQRTLRCVVWSKSARDKWLTPASSNLLARRKIASSSFWLKVQEHQEMHPGADAPERPNRAAVRTMQDITSYHYSTAAESSSTSPTETWGSLAVLVYPLASLLPTKSADHVLRLPRLIPFSSDILLVWFENPPPPFSPSLFNASILLLEDVSNHCKCYKM